MFLLMASLFTESGEHFRVPYGLLTMGSGNLATTRQG